ncbi:uncharacterized protein LOC142331597 [Lycorma delicatula]|uniref:uncharacterized protein LOC142331597 n=1 Tax=Lycorma delicatula TaxID=130591 RepID=UPI003F515720
MLIYKILLSLQYVAALITIINGIPFEDCGSNDCSVNSVSVENCSPNDVPCYVKSNSLSFYINFTTNYGIYNSVTAVGSARKWGLKKQIFLKEDICNDSIICPIQPSVNYIYAEHIEIPDWVPKGKASIEWSLSSGGISILCVEVAMAK